MNELKYNIEKMIIGKHDNATRSHYHIGTIVTYQSKTYIKHFHRKLREQLTQKKATDVLGDFKISFRHQTDEEYNEANVLQYPLKEKDNDHENKRLYDAYSKGITEEEFKSYTITSQAIYNQAKYEKEQKEKKDILKKSNADTKYEYLDQSLGIIANEISPTFITLREQTLEEKIKKCLIICLKFEKHQHELNQKKVFKISSHMDLVLSYLYFRNLTTEEELIYQKFKM